MLKSVIDKIEWLNVIKWKALTLFAMRFFFQFLLSFSKLVSCESLRHFLFLALTWKWIALISELLLSNQIELKIYWYILYWYKRIHHVWTKLGLCYGPFWMGWPTNGFNRVITQSNYKVQVIDHTHTFSGYKIIYIISINFSKIPIRIGNGLAIDWPNFLFCFFRFYLVCMTRNHF